MDVAECPVCYQEFDRPLQLSCGHTVCATCVDRMVNSEQQQADGDRHGLGIADLNAAVVAGARAPGARGHADVLPPANQQPEPPRIFELRNVHRNLNHHDANGNGGFGGLGGALFMHQQFQPDMMGNHPAVQLQAMNVEHQRPIWQAFEQNLGYPHRVFRATLRQRVTRIRCPECRSMTEVPVNGLPVNYRLKEMIERIKREKELEASLSQSVFTIACSECDKQVEKGVYFVCGACPDKPRICSLCIVRLHIKHGDEIIERKALTEQDLIDRLEKVNQGAAVAAQTTINIGNIVDRLNDCGAEMKQGLEQAQRAFEEVSSSLRKINRNSTAEEADEYVNAATEVSESFKQLEKKVSEIRKDLSISLENSVKEFNDRIKIALQSSPLPIVKREIKGEPIDKDEDVVLLETNRPYLLEAVQSPLEDLFRRSPTPYPEVGDENAGETLGVIERPPVAETSQAFTIPRNPERNRPFGEQEAREQQLAPEDALDLITNQARHIRVARTPSPDEQAAVEPPSRRRRRNDEIDLMMAELQRSSSRVAGRPQNRFNAQTMIDRSNRRRRRMFSAVSDEAAPDQPGPSNR